MSNERTFPGFPEKPAAAIEQRAKIGRAVIEVHSAMRPILDILDSQATISMAFKVAGDTVKVSITPGKPNDEVRR
jgi:hypothetical protein